MECSACGSLIVVLTEQTRAADEPRSFIETCPQCPLKVSQFKNELILPHVNIPRRIRNKAQLPTLDLSDSTDLLVVSVVLESVPEFGDMLIQEALCYNVIDNDHNTYKYYSSGPYCGLAIRQQSATTIGPFAQLVVYSAVNKIQGQSVPYVGFKYYQKDNIIYIMDPSSLYVIEIVDQKSNTSIAEQLHSLYFKTDMVKSLSSLISSVKIGSISNLTSRAYDSSEFKKQDYIYSTKPDGERMWLTRIGIVWVFSRRLVKHSIVSWYVDPCLPLVSDRLIGPCIDIEMLHSHPPILIDVLLDEQGTPSPQERNVQWIQHKFKELQSKFQYLDIVYVREFRDTIEEATKDRNCSRYPTDGLVAIHKDSTDMLKIKEIKSIELKVLADGILASEDDTELLRTQESNRFVTGSIVEIRFKIVNGIFKVIDSFARTDKTIANRLDAIHSIVSSSLSTESKSIVRNQLWRWSNIIRSRIYDRSKRMSLEKKIMIDIGSGSGQSTESFLKDKSYILIEPDKRSSEQLARRLDIRLDLISNQPRSIIPIIPRMKQGRLKYHIINCRLQEFLEDEIVKANIRGLIGACTASFSAQYITDCLDILRVLQIPFIGSCYVYDSISNGKSIIDSDGLLMKRITDKTAIVKWGKDIEYNEPALETTDLPVGTIIMNATEELPYVESHANDPGIKVSSHLKILIY